VRQRKRLFAYYFFAGCLGALPVLLVMLPFFVPGQGRSWPWPELIGFTLLAGLCAGGWAVILGRRYFGPFKGVLTALLALVSFNIVYALYLHGFKQDTLVMMAVFSWWGALLFWWVLLPIGLVTGMLYRARTGDDQPSLDKPSRHREYAWSATVLGAFLAVNLSIWLIDYDVRIFEVPAGFTGILCVEFNNPACPWQQEFFKRTIIQVDARGRGCTSAPLRYRSDTDDIYEVSGEQRTLVPTRRLRFLESDAYACLRPGETRRPGSAFLRIEIVPY
jgi:hypothetical protein